MHKKRAKHKNTAQVALVRGWDWQAKDIRA